MNPDRTPRLAAARGEIAGTSYSVHAPKSGEAPATVVLIHGVGMNQSVWSSQIEPLTAANYEVVVYDMLGHGASALPPAEPTLDDYAAQLERLLDGLDIEQAHVAGHSMGALVALEFALTRAPRTLSVAALNAVYDRSPAQREAVMSRAATLGDAPLDRGGNAGVDATLKRWFGDPVPAHLTQAAQAVRHLLLSVDPVGYARTYGLFACSDDVHVGRLTSLAVPALFLTAELDLNSSPDMSWAMAEAAPFGRAEVIAGARHMMNVSHPEEVTARLLAFFAEAAQRNGANATNVGDDHV
ncbi:alpha/beta fold hydrolase [Paraburkholderia rhynchosiae]|uniref:(E)-2-((N-methylformamido)methylene)succinate hydrolase n=1 Tax=Paraburkholderia rhynchosiae TaxID=487049 RepID=A0A2N7WHE0_9BURK|nr:alpha/beta fold hydrolase [Paraburkholderia rhynchosiae]PMS28840.1 alpha/beta hydrolase [Paraburkholderia rhynchosiae]CAB3655477.1 (E)-2-((N-methylformamido)methylene)succinate hydrolase [Paraburkholderia rhynchosiae]